ncbi:MAG: pyridoxal 5'-phosphate synthase glutaminase subunit PdxT [Acidimicrobiales bacterium]
MKVGILALQGDVAEHARVLSDLGAVPVEVRRPEDLGGVDALVLPGGESTTMSLLLESSGLQEAVADRLAGGMPALGTCAGMILLGTEVIGGRADQRCFSAIDVSVRRNAFGRQLQSFEADLDVSGVDGGPVRAVFIRAPVVERAGPGVEVLASVELVPPWGEPARAEPAGEGRGVWRDQALLGQRSNVEGPWPVVCREGPVMVVSFHPELSGDARLHQLFLSSL